MTQPGQVSHGMPARPNEVQRQIRDLQRQINEMHGAVTKAANAANQAAATANAGLQIVRHLQGDSSPVTLTGSWVRFDLGTITAPAGYTRMDYSISVSAGTTFTAGGLIGVQPAVWIPTYPGGEVEARGPAISNGATGAVATSVSAYFANGGTGNDPAYPIHFGLYAYRSGTATASSDNVHASASVFFTK